MPGLGTKQGCFDNVERVNLVEEGNPVNSKLTILRYIAVLPFLIVILAVAVVIALEEPLVWWACGALTIFIVFVAWLIPHQVRLIRWKEDSDDLIISKGKMWHTITVVPYGRIQFIEVSEGPLESRFGLGTIKLNTASASSDATIPGLPKDQAHELRVRLSERAKKMQAL